VLKPGISARVFRTPEDAEHNTMFNYIDTASDRVGIGSLSAKLEGEVVSIIGTSGTGGYIPR
jgi:ABC-type histidine transport system ATPase subunit